MKARREACSPRRRRPTTRSCAKWLRAAGRRAAAERRGLGVRRWRTSSPRRRAVPGNRARRAQRSISSRYLLPCGLQQARGLGPADLASACDRARASCGSLPRARSACSRGIKRDGPARRRSRIRPRACRRRDASGRPAGARTVSELAPQFVRLSSVRHGSGAAMRSAGGRRRDDPDDLTPQQARLSNRLLDIQTPHLAAPRRGQCVDLSRDLGEDAALPGSATPRASLMRQAARRSPFACRERARLLPRRPEAGDAGIVRSRTSRRAWRPRSGGALRADDDAAIGAFGRPRLPERFAAWDRRSRAGQGRLLEAQLIERFVAAAATARCCRSRRFLGRHRRRR